MTILVIGGTGFISSLLVRELLQRAHSVTLFTRGKREAQFAGDHRIHLVRGDRSIPGTLASSFQGRMFDVVFDMIAFTSKESTEAAAVFRGKVGRFIHCSTISVYMVSRQVQCPITEDQSKAPLMEFWPRNPFGMEYGIKKRECEDVLWKAHDDKLFPVSMVRPTFASGPADPAKRDYFWIQRILDAGPILVPGSGDHAFQQVYVGDVALTLTALLDRPTSIGKAYNVAGEEIFSLNDYLHALATLMNREVSLVHIPQDEFDQLSISSHPRGDVFPFNTRRTAVFNLDAIKRDIGYRSTPFHQWMQKTIAWWATGNRGDSIGYERRPMELELAAQRLIPAS
jgi:nucleoside-diphosphate-sugar epimerase